MCVPAGETSAQLPLHLVCHQLALTDERLPLSGLNHIMGNEKGWCIYQWTPPLCHFVLQNQSTKIPFVLFIDAQCLNTWLCFRKQDIEVQTLCAARQVETGKH